MWSRAVLTRYWLLQLPGTAFIAVALFLLQDTLGLSTRTLSSIIGIWVAKDVALYPLVWRSYDPDPANTAHSLEGERGVVVDTLAPTGYVRVRGELWRAKLTGRRATAENGSAVRVKEVRGLTLLVEGDIPDYPSGKIRNVPIF